MKELRGLQQFARERPPKIGCPFGKHAYDKNGACACGRIKASRKKKAVKI
jgi:hypothetical protein